MNKMFVGKLNVCEKEIRKLVGDRPYERPHHTISKCGMDGVFERLKRNNGVLVLIEFSEFCKSAVDYIAAKVEEYGIECYAHIYSCPCEYMAGCDGYNGCHCSENRKLKYGMRIPDDIRNMFEVVTCED